MTRKPYWAAAKHELHEHESVLSFSCETSRGAFVSSGGGMHSTGCYRDARAVSDDEAVRIGALSVFGERE